jgi:hypothetical protein
MFVIPVKYNGYDYVVKCVKSIREQGMYDKIVVVDSNSSDKSYFDRLSVYDVTIEDIGNKNYSDGAMWYCYNKYPEEEFIFSIHDSMVVNENLNFLKKQDFTAFCYFDIQYLGPGGPGGGESLDYCIYKLNQLGYNPDYEEMYSFPGLFGSIFFSKRSILEKIHDLGFNKILPTNKAEACANERLWGFFLKKVDINIKEHNLMGNYINSNKSNAIRKTIVCRQ